MKSNNKTFVPDLSGYVSGDPGKGRIRYGAKLISNVRFNEFENGSAGEVFIDRADSQNTYSFQVGQPNSSLASVYTQGALTGKEIYERPAITHQNFAGSPTKMTVEYNQQCLSLGDRYQPERTFVRLDDANAIRAFGKTGQGRTIMLRVMVDSSRTGASTDFEDKAVLAIGDSSGTTTYQITVTGDAGSNDIRLNSRVIGASASTSSVSSQPLTPGKWYTFFFTAKNLPSSGATATCSHSIKYYGLSDGAAISAPSASDSVTANTIDESGLSMFIGYGEDNGGLNADYRLSDFVRGVHIAEMAVWDGALESSVCAQIAGAHRKEGRYESGIDSRPVKRVQQIYDAMDTYPQQRQMTGARLFDDTKESTYDTTNEVTFGAIHPELMVYPEMIPARLYSGSGGTFAFGESYNPHSVQLKDGQMRDIRATPFEFKMLATGAMYPGISHRETETLNRINVSAKTTQNITGSVSAALGGKVLPFDDGKADGSDIIDIKAVDETVYPGLNQRLGDVVRIEIPIPTTEDCVMGVDAGQGRIASMAYYNPSTQKWDRVGFLPGISGSNVRSIDYLNGEYSSNDGNGNRNNFFEDVRKFLVNSCSIGFGGTSGFSIYSDEGSRALMELPSRGRPTSMFGFPHTDQYVASAPQTIKISDYIDQPFLLEKMAVEFEAEVEEAGPSSLATKIRTPSRWKFATQTVTTRDARISNPDTNTDNEANSFKVFRSGLGAAQVFHRSVESHRDASVTINGRTLKDSISAQVNFPRIGASRFQKYLFVEAEPGAYPGFKYGSPSSALLNASAHIGKFPIFMGGSTKPAYADAFDLFQQRGEELDMGVTNAARIADFGKYPDSIIGGSKTAGAINLPGTFNPEPMSNTTPAHLNHTGAGRFFNVSVDRLYAIQDTANDINSWSGGARIQFRGRFVEGSLGGVGLYRNEGSGMPGVPDIQRAVTGYYSSAPTLFTHYNIPAGIFLPQIERAPSADPSKPRGRKDGADHGGYIKLLYGGISGLVTGSYLPSADTNHVLNYYSSGSDPREGETQKGRGYVDPAASGATVSYRFGKSNYLSRNYISFVDSYFIDADGNMTSTTMTARNVDPTGDTAHRGLGRSTATNTGSNTEARDDYYGQGTIGKSTGGVPFWRCDTFFLLHQRPGKKRFIGGEIDIQAGTEKQSFEKLEGTTRGFQPIDGGESQGVDTERKDSVYEHYDGVDGSETSLQIVKYVIPDHTHQSALIQDSFDDGLNVFATGQPNVYKTVRPQRNKRITLEETLDEFVSSTRTTNRELITYAQMTHYGYAAAEAVIPGAIIPPENYYQSASLLKEVGLGNQSLPVLSGSDYHGDPAVDGSAGGNILLPMSRSFYTQAIKLGAVQGSTFTNLGGNTSGQGTVPGYNGGAGAGGTSLQYCFWPVPGSGMKTGYFTYHRLSPIATVNYGPRPLVILPGSKSDLFSI